MEGIVKKILAIFLSLQTIHCFSKSFLSCSGAVVPSHPGAARDPPGPEV
jgi:hypothetical protein